MPIGYFEAVWGSSITKALGTERTIWRKAALRQERSFPIRTFFNVAGIAINAISGPADHFRLQAIVRPESILS
jgi:hypothetical protein